MQSRLPSLDGLRAISILGVLYAHLTITPNFSFTDNVVVHFFLSFIAGDNGVNIFFVISGFLITTLLLSEEEKLGTISLKGFYVRRIFRILPVYCSFLLVVFLCNHFSWIKDIEAYSFIAPLTFTTGVLPVNTGWTLGHTWSLSVEEQFYLLWPFTVFFLKKVQQRNIVLLTALLLIPIVRTIYYYTTHNSLFYNFLVRGDAIVLGCLLAVNQKIVVNFFKNRNLIRFVLLFIAALCFAVHYFSTHQLYGFITVPLGILIHAFFAAMLIIGYVIKPNTNSVIYAALNNRVLVFIGVLSYSLYIWQQFFLQKAATVSSNWKHYPVNIILVFVTAIGSYYLLEQPLLKLRKKYFKA